MAVAPRLWRWRGCMLQLLLFSMILTRESSLSAIVPPTDAPSNLPTPRAVNCSILQRLQMQYSANSVTVEPALLVNIPSSDTNQNCSDHGGGPEVSVFHPGEEFSQWKNNIIVGCTVAAAVEVVIVVVIFLYWNQIRWTLRKIVCPCGRRRSLSEAESGERRSQASVPHSQSHDTEQAPEQEMLNYSQTRQSRDSEEEIDSHDLELAPHLEQRSGVLEYEDFYSRDSSSIDGHSHSARRFIPGHKPDSMSYASAINYYQISSECGSSYGPPDEESNMNATTATKQRETNVDALTDSKSTEQSVVCRQTSHKDSFESQNQESPNHIHNKDEVGVDEGQGEVTPACSSCHPENKEGVSLIPKP